MQRASAEPRSAEETALTSPHRRINSHDLTELTEATKTGDASGGDAQPYCVDGNSAWVQITKPTGALALTK